MIYAETTLDDVCIPVVGGIIQSQWQKSICSIVADLRRLSYAVSYDTVESVVSAYYDLQIEDSNLPAINYLTETPAQVEGQLKLKLRVAELSAQPIDRVDDILQAMFWGSRDGRVNVRVALPRQFHWEKGDPRSESNAIVSYARTAFYVIVGSGILYGVYKAVELTKMFSAQTQTSKKQ